MCQEPATDKGKTSGRPPPTTFRALPAPEAADCAGLLGRVLQQTGSAQQTMEELQQKEQHL